MAGSFAGMSHALVAPLLNRRGRTWKDGMAENEPWQDPKSPQDARLASLDERLRRAQAEGAARTGRERHAAPKGQVQGARVLSVLVSYPAGSALIGYLIDRLAGTRGIWVAMLFLGFGAAMWEVWKISQQRPE
ncbi:MAG TPA: AtpZ/AtpI family protein [Allosphingosinicella sp.]|nr:AtpZ/AtpI family protein [Allosphingosinicella sp.]